MFDEDIPLIQPNWDREVWLLDPGPFIDIAFDLGMSNFVFRAQYHERKDTKQDFTKWIDLFSRGRSWRVIWTPFPGDFAVAFDSDHGWKNPIAVWRIWRANKNSFNQMDQYFNEPPKPGTVIGHFGVNSRTHSTPVAVVPGQEHRVLLANMPMEDGLWGSIASHAQQLQATNPEHTLHFHGQKSVGRTIGIAVKSFDHPVRLGWKDGYPRVLLGNGMEWGVLKNPTVHQEQWLRIIGIDPKALMRMERKEQSRKVYETNLRSLKWAFLNWDRAWDFRRASDEEEDIESSDVDWSPQALPVRIRKTKTEVMELDRWLCDTCSIQFRCPYSRQGSVCIVPDSEASHLPEMFGTRNADQIINGLVSVLTLQAHRVEQGVAAERKMQEAILEDPEKSGTGLSPEVTRIVNSLFDRGVVLAKLVSPRLAAQGAPKINIGIVTGNNGTAVTTATPQALMQGVAAELESRGIALEDATEEIINQILSESVPIEATAREGTQ